MNDQDSFKGEGRPYRSHLHPACLSCKKRKSRCKTRNSSDVCIMCQAHGTECIFPRPDDNYQSRVLSSLRKSPANVKHRFAYRSYGPLHARAYSNPATSGTGVDPQVPATLVDLPQISCASGYEQSAENLPNLVDIVTEAGNDSSHVVSPAVAGDNAILESYLCVASTSRNRCLPTRPTSTRPMRPVRFDIVPRRPLGVATVQSLAASKCEVIEKYLDPDIEEYLNLWVPNLAFLHARIGSTDLQ